MATTEADYRAEYIAGRGSFEAGETRTDNPYLFLAIAWDKGWVSSAREQEATTPAPTRILGFQAWITAQGH